MCRVSCLACYNCLFNTNPATSESAELCAGAAVDLDTGVVEHVQRGEKKLTQVGSVVDRVTDEEHGEEGSNDGLAGSVLSVKVTSLDSTTTLLRSIALGEALVETNDTLHAGRRTTGALCGLGGSDLGWDGEGGVGTNTVHAESVGRRTGAGESSSEHDDVCISVRGGGERW